MATLTPVLSRMSFGVYPSPFSSLVTACCKVGTNDANKPVFEDNLKQLEQLVAEKLERIKLRAQIRSNNLDALNAFCVSWFGEEGLPLPYEYYLLLSLAFSPA